MASGVFRPYTVEDIIGSLSGSISALSASSTSQGTGEFTEADETCGVTDSATVSAQANPHWNAGEWSSFCWG